MENKEKDKYVVSNFFNERIEIPLEKTLAQNPIEALQKTINEVGKIDLDILQSYLPNMELEKIIYHLTSQYLIFPSLEKEEYELAEEFLSGNVKSKYNKIQKMIENGEKFNLFSISLNEIAEKLKENFPQYLYFEDIEVNLGSNFVSLKIYEDFIKNTFLNEPEKIKIKIHYNNGTYIIEDFKKEDEIFDPETQEIKLQLNKIFSSDLNNNAINVQVNNEKNEIFFNLKDMLENILNGKSLEVFHYEDNSNKENSKIKVIESVPTKIALDNADMIKDFFQMYCLNNKSIMDEIEKEYNNKINVFSFKKNTYLNFLQTPNLNKDIKLRPHQKNAIAKGIFKQSLLLDHQVGAGKTLAAISLVMEQVRMKIIKKALILVPNHLVLQWGEEFKRAYPNANIIMGDKIDNKKDRKDFLYKVKYGKFDAIIMKHSTFENMNVMESFQMRILHQYKENLEKIIIKSKKDKLSNKELLRYLDRKLNQLEKKLEKKAIGKKADKEIAFEQLGIDALVVDEAHYFKNLYFDTNQNNIKGLANTDSSKAMKMYSATQYCHENNFKLYFLTGTPVSNSISEFYTMQKYLQPDILKELELENFDDWQKAFTKITLNEELDSSGVNYKITARLSKFINAPELMNIYNLNADVVTTKDIEEQIGRLVPKVKNGKAINIVAPRSDDIAHYIGIEDENGQYNLGSIIWRMDNLHSNPRNNNVLKCTSDARKCAIDYRLIDNKAEDYEDSKVNKMINNILIHYNDEKYPKNTQIVFLDIGVSKKHSQKINIDDDNIKEAKTIEEIALEKNLVLMFDEEKNENFYAEVEITENGKEKIKKRYSIEELLEEQGEAFDVYADILQKLVKNGIKQEEIAFIGDAKNDKQKKELFEKINAGDIRIIIGSTQKMGAGTNIQKRIIAIHDLDCPWRPADLEQRAGRAIRQGNLFFENDKENFEIFHYRYATEQTYDSRMFQINEQKLLPLIQLKELNSNNNKRIFDSIDSEVANIAEMKAYATGNPFILEKHKLTNFLKTEERFFEQYKKNILQSKRSIEVLINKETFLKEKINFLNNSLFNKEFEKEDYQIEAFGYKINKKNENDENKNLKNKINKEIKKIFDNPNGEKIKILQSNGITLYFKNFFYEGKDKIYFKGILEDNYKNTIEPDNMLYTSDYGNVFFKTPEIDGILEKIKNFITKSNQKLKFNNQELKEIQYQINLKNDFLSKNNFENYDRKLFLNCLKQDLRNMNEIFNIRSRLLKKGIKLKIDDPQIKDLLPKYKKYLNEKGKIVVLDKDEKKDDISNENNKIEIKNIEINIKKYDEKENIDEKVKLLEDNYKNIINSKRVKDFLN